MYDIEEIINDLETIREFLDQKEIKKARFELQLLIDILYHQIGEGYE